MVSTYRADANSAEDAAGRAFECARRAGHVRGQGEALFFGVLCLLMSPTPVEEGLRRCDDALAAGAGPMAEAAVRMIAATLHALQGDIEKRAAPGRPRPRRVPRARLPLQCGGDGAMRGAD